MPAANAASTIAVTSSASVRAPNALHPTPSSLTIRPLSPSVR
jgi:hypothetical protein